ncbi:MAG: hypothetical protein EU549_05310 [Promethearchaeota archaeon]|nr:MAG: hypothetical protein EU549_05310 [Candidatus Lokiarchaeota archaeon]
MPTKNTNESDKKKSKMDRVTVSLDTFDYKVVNQMASNRDLSLSEVVRNIIHNWIEFNPDLLEKNYGINVEEITKEIIAETTEISEIEIINRLPKFFEIVEEVTIGDLADYFDVSKRFIKDLLFEKGEEIKNLGLNIKLKGETIYIS